MESDRRIVSRAGWLGAFGLGASQILALLPGISRDGTVMVCGMFRGLSRQDAARFSFLLSAPGHPGRRRAEDPRPDRARSGPGSGAGAVRQRCCPWSAAYISLRFLIRYFSDPKRTLTPFAIYCLVAGLGCAIYLSVR